MSWLEAVPKFFDIAPLRAFPRAIDIRLGIIADTVVAGASNLARVARAAEEIRDLILKRAVAESEGDVFTLHLAGKDSTKGRVMKMPAAPSSYIQTLDEIPEGEYRIYTERLLGQPVFITRVMSGYEEKFHGFASSVTFHHVGHPSSIRVTFSSYNL